MNNKDGKISQKFRDGVIKIFIVFKFIVIAFIQVIFDSRKYLLVTFEFLELFVKGFFVIYS